MGKNPFTNPTGWFLKKQTRHKQATHCLTQPLQKTTRSSKKFLFQKTQSFLERGKREVAETCVAFLLSGKTRFVFWNFLRETLPEAKQKNPQMKIMPLSKVDFLTCLTFSTNWKTFVIFQQRFLKFLLQPISPWNWVRKKFLFLVI